MTGSPALGSPALPASSALFTDRYELTMVDAALKAGEHDRPSVFEAFARRLPGGRRYGVVAGTGRLLELIERFTFGEEELTWLGEERVVGPETLDWLAGYRFTGTIHGYREGEVYFPGSPLLVVEAPFAEAVVLETLILSTLNYDSAVATAAARMVSAAAGRPLAEMGSRRANESAAVAAARAAFIAGFAATSNLEAGRRWQIPTMGTAAHSFTLLFDSEEEAFRAQVQALGTETTLLVDTYDIPSAIEAAVRVAGSGLGSVRIDSGDLAPLVGQVRELLDALGATGTTITVTSDLDEYAIAALAASPVDSYGVGTSVVTGSGSPAAGMVYKLVERRGHDGRWRPVAKTSAGKVGVGGRKSAMRRLSDGVAVAEVVHCHDPDDAGPGERTLLHPLLVDGRPDPDLLGSGGVRRAREHRAAAIAELPLEALRLARGGPAIPTVYTGAPDSDAPEADAP